MSIQAIGAVLEAPLKNPALKMLLVAMANAHNTTTGLCAPSIDRLAAESGMSRSSVQRKLAWLYDEGWIDMTERFAPNGRQQTYSFRLVFLTENVVPRVGRDLGCQIDTLPLPEGVNRATLPGSSCDTLLENPEEEPLLPPKPPSSTSAGDDLSAAAEALLRQHSVQPPPAKRRGPPRDHRAGMAAPQPTHERALELSRGEPLVQADDPELFRKCAERTGRWALVQTWKSADFPYEVVRAAKAELHHLRKSSAMEGRE